MTVIAWDGKILAADRRADSAGWKTMKTCKIFAHDAYLCGFAGDHAVAMELVAWFKGDRNPDNYPKFLNPEGKSWARLVCIDPLTGKIDLYETTPFPLEMETPIFAMGSGRDFALAAMHLGESAIGAVSAASYFDTGCGNGVDFLTKDDIKC